MPASKITVAAGSRTALSTGTVIDTGDHSGNILLVPSGSSGLRTPGRLRGVAKTKKTVDAASQLDAAFAELGIEEQETIEFDAAPMKRRSGLRSRAGDDAIGLEPAPPAKEDMVQVILYQDESGGLSWHFPDGFFSGPPETAPRLRGRRGSTGHSSFTIPGRTVEAQAAVRKTLTDAGRPGTRRLRGTFTKIGRKVFKVLLLPVLSKLVGSPVEAIVGAIERRSRSEHVRALTSDNYREKIVTPFDGWQSLKGRRSLLVVHGIFSSIEGMLANFPREAMEELSRHYEGRMIGFDQLTVSRSPVDNACFFLEEAKKAAQGGDFFEFDILCHSRGGIVSRTLAERGGELVKGHPCRFKNIFFVATPNNGSVLGNPDHMVDMVDVFTNIFTSFPDGPVMYTIESVLAILKLLVHSAESVLPGLASMGTETYIRELNDAGAKSGAAYAAAAADYEPDPKADNAFITGKFSTNTLNRIFRDDKGAVANDLIVPFEGVAGKNGHPSFPIEDVLKFGKKEHVWHSGFFSRPETFAAIKRHFGVSTSALESSEWGECFSAPADAPSLWPEPALPAPAPATRYVHPAPAAPAPDKSVGYSPAPALEPRPLPAAPDGPAFEPHLRPPARDVAREILWSPAAAPAESEEPLPPSPPPPAAPRRSRLRGSSGDRPRGDRSVGRMHPARPGESSPPPAPTELKREPKIDFHENVVVGEANDLVVSLEDLLATTPKEKILKIALPAGATEAQVMVELSAPGFDVMAVSAPVMTIKTVRDPALERVKFTLTARSLGSEPVLREITANFWLRHTCIGAISRKTYIIPQGYNKEKPGSDECVSAGFVMPNGKRVECDFLVTVQGDDEAGLPPFRLSLRSVVPGQEDNGTYMGKLVLDGAGPTLGKYLDDFYAKHFDKYPDAEDNAVFTNEFEGWRDEFMEGLRAIGQKLWTFLPERFRREYFRLHALDALPTSILVHSDEMILPWELIVPWDKVEGRLVTLEPLGRRHILGRWKPGLRTKPQPQRYRVRRFCIVNPVYPDPDTLESAAWETEQLRRLLPQVSVISPANRATVKNQVLSKDDVNVFHFNGHGEIDPNNADLNTLLLEDGGALEALQVTGSKLAVEGAPVVYLNACHAGNTSAAVGRMAGFCANFLESGCSGVIAPYWPVDDKRAAEFSVNLYQKLSKGEAIGAALRDLRREHPDDFTYAAFSYFGDPCASLDLGSMVS